MSVDFFERIEKKYIIDKALFCKLTDELKPYIMPDEEWHKDGKYSIRNIYYDTPTDALIRNSIEKPAFKEKMRVRVYGEATDESEAYIEIKRKSDGVVYKRRIGLTLRDAEEYLNNNTVPDNCNLQVLKEIDYFKNFYSVVPKVYISYDRTAYIGRENKKLRITFDENIVARRTQLDIKCGCFGEAVISRDKVVMEIKCEKSLPLWFTKFLSEYKIYPTSFSKYGTEYKNSIKKS